MRIETNDGTAEAPRIAMNTDGNVFVVWHQHDGSRNHIWSNRYRVGAGWETAKQVEANDTSDAKYPDIAIDRYGDAIVTWQLGDGATQGSAWANAFTDGLGWGTPILIGPVNGISFPTNIVMDQSGNAMASMFQWDGIRASYWTIRYGTDSGWGTATLMESIVGPFSPRPGLAVHPNGSIVALWPHENAGINELWALWFK